MADTTDSRHRDSRGRDSSGDRPAGGLAQELSDLARSLQAEPDLDQTLQGIVTAAVASIPGAVRAGITHVDRHGQVTTPAATDDLVRAVDRLQYDTRQGPCLQSIQDQATVHSDDLRSETRWPAFGAAAADLGVAAMLSFQLYVHDQELGALNLYADRVGAFDDHDEQVGLLLASHAAIAMVGAQKQHNLDIAVHSRDVIGQAKGILMERHKITADQAFQLLVRASSTGNRKIRDLADELTRTGEDPGVGRPPHSTGRPG